MRAADVASVVVFVLLAGGVGAGFFYWKAETARAEEARYESGVDAMFERKLDSVGLAFVAPALAAQAGPARLEALRGLYADPDQSDRINLGFGTARGDWARDFPRFAEESGRVADRARFEAELEERYGPGSYALMLAQYDAFIADAPRRNAEAQAREEAEMQALIARTLRNAR